MQGYEDSGTATPPLDDDRRYVRSRRRAWQSSIRSHCPKAGSITAGQLNPDTPFNFVNTADIIGGNSGSPVVNRAGEFVGIIFDGNIYSLVLAYAYTDEKARAIGVHSAGILEVLKNVYNARELADELGH